MGFWVWNPLSSDAVVPSLHYPETTRMGTGRLLFEFRVKHYPEALSDSELGFSEEAMATAAQLLSSARNLCDSIFSQRIF